MLNISELEKLLIEASESKNIKQVREISKQCQYVDFAEALEQTDEKAVLRIFRMLEIEEAAEIFTYLSSEHQEFIISSFTSAEVQEIVDELYTDDIIDVIDDMPAQVVKKILKAATKEQRKEINSILKYDEETAGGIMSVNFTELKADDTVEKAIKIIRRRHEDYDEIDDLYVTDSIGKLLGHIEIKDLILNQPSQKMSEIMDSKIVSVASELDQEEVGIIFKRYDLNTLPVVDKQEKLVGIITVDDVIDVLVEEATEDLQKFAGINDAKSDYFETTIFKMFKSRSIWLMAMLVLGTITQILLVVFFGIYNKEASQSNSDQLLLLLLPMILIVAGIAGSSGNQSALMMVRSLSLRQIHKKEVKEIILKEFTVSILITLPLVLINIVRLILIYLVQYKGDLSSSNVWIAIGTSSLGLILSIIFANILGCMLPLLAKTFKLDPTLASSPLVTTLVDIAAVAIFLGVGTAFL
ncbi:magnesium transporter [Mesoplasma syrphidae]|uniref:Magnesium transporter MgtE n=1 Tax=Mesoplasma syrphidae TaxID=225999 RepID=A0A2K9BKR9_9MOLU|nr:magnesium transporter [Mesoplasma syrphidae]AUF83826.1 magnesium transporter [Mesoplasma syrphidae]